MAWPGTLSTKTTGELVDADDWNDLINAINHLGNTHDHSGDSGDGGTPAFGLVKLAEQEVTGSSVANITFSSIPGTYAELYLSLLIRPATNSVTLNLELNADTGSNYEWNNYSNAVSQYSVSDTKIPLNAGNLKSAADDTNTVGLWIPRYAQTNDYHPLHWLGSFISINTPQDIIYMAGGGQWKSTSQITQVKLYMSSGNIDVGSHVFLYGVVA
jgi:hypothetical protein